jgi:alkylation response protein AidB-like acyl-CoA dehydrogenase
VTTTAPSQSSGASGALTDGLIGLAARYDAAPIFPSESLRLLREHGLARRFAPPEGGGATFADSRSYYREMADALRLVGRCDLSVGRLFEGHVNALLLFGWYGTPQQLAWLSTALDGGAWFGVWATEPAPGVQLSVGPTAVLHGAKCFASGAGGLAYALITAAGGSAHRQLVLVPANDASRTENAHWRVRGMRASVSGHYDVTGLGGDAIQHLGEPGDYDREPRFTAGAWRFCAVQLGGIEALLTETRAQMSDVARGDPVQRARFADAIAATRTAGFWVAEAARRAACEDIDAVEIARMTRGVVERTGLDVMEAAARILGTRSAFDGERADKIIRDLSLYLRQGGPDHARDQAALAWLDHDCWPAGGRLW